MARTRQVTPIELELLHSAYTQRIALVPQIALAQVVTDKLRDKGIRLTKAERKALLEEIRKDPVQFELPPGENGRLLDCCIQINSGDLAPVKEAVDRLEEDAPKIFDEMAENAVEKILKDLKRAWPKEFRSERIERSDFAKRLQRTWGRAFDPTMHFLTVCAELSAGFRARIDSDPSRPVTWELLTRLHGRGIRTAEEVLCLLASGFADGALARWRTLHEIAVTSLFVVSHGEDAAIRYVDHQWVEAKKRMEELSKPPWPGVSDEEFEKEQERIESVYQDLIIKYGKNFAYDYGWAAHHLKATKPTFRDIEKSVNANMWRPHYQRASAWVHAGAKGTYTEIGLPMLLLGPSNAGLDLPAVASIHALLELTQHLVWLKPTLDVVVTMKILQSIASEAEDAFEECARELDAREAGC